MRGRRQEMVALVAALSLHAGALWCLRATLRESISSLRTGPAPPPAHEWEIELAGAPEADTPRVLVPETPRANVHGEAPSAPRAHARRAELASADEIGRAS